MEVENSTSERKIKHWSRNYTVLQQINVESRISKVHSQPESRKLEVPGWKYKNLYLFLIVPFYSFIKSLGCIFIFRGKHIFRYSSFYFSTITWCILWNCSFKNCFLAYDQIMRSHYKDYIAPFMATTWWIDIATFKLLLCWQTHDVWLQLLNCFLVEKHHKFQPWRKQLLNSFLMNTQHVDSTNFNWSCTKKFTIIRQGLFPSTSFYTSSKFRSWMVNHLFLEV